jgi:hypothetical protein
MEGKKGKMGNGLELLELCEDINEIDVILDKIGIVDDVAKRNLFLINYMGVKRIYQNGEINIKEQYELTKEVLIEKDWKYMKGYD